MATLEDLTPVAAIRGILPNAIVTVINTEWFGSHDLELTYKTPEGTPGNRLLYRQDEAELEVVDAGRRGC